MNTDALLGVAELIEEKDRFTLAAWAIFHNGSRGDVMGIAGTRDGRRKPTIDEMLHDPQCYGCVSGWTNVWSGYSDLEDWWHASRVLGLDAPEARQLFFAAQDTSIWRRAGKLAGWPGGNYRSITAVHAGLMLRGLASGEIMLTARGVARGPTGGSHRGPRRP